MVHFCHSVNVSVSNYPGIYFSNDLFESIRGSLVSILHGDTNIVELVSNSMAEHGNEKWNGNIFLFFSYRIPTHHAENPEEPHLPFGGAGPGESSSDGCWTGHIHA